MKKEKEQINKNSLNQRSNKIRLTKKIDSKGNNTSIFNNSCNNIPSIDPIQNRLMKYKNNKVSQNYTQNQSSIINKTSMLENSSINNKDTYSISSYINRKSVKNNNNITNSSFYLRDEDKNKQKKKLINQSMFRLSKDVIIKRNDKLNNRDNISSFRSNINNKREEYKKAYSKKKTEKEIQNKINKMSKNSFGKVNKYEKKSKNFINNNNDLNDNNQLKENNNNEKDTNNIKDHKNRFNRVKTLGELRKKNIDNINAEKDKINNNIPNIKNVNKDKMQRNYTNLYDKKEKTQKNYTNLYDKYIDKFKEKMNKVTTNKNYRDDKVSNVNNNNIIKKNINKRRNMQRTLTCKKIENNKNIKRDYSQREILKDKPNKKIIGRKSGKSIGNINKNYNQSKSKSKNKNIENKNNKNSKDGKNKKRSKSVVKLFGNISIKNDIDEKCDIETVLYGEVKPSKNDDPFDDVETVVKAIDFDRINVYSKNIFREDNDKYKDYCEKFENIFNKFVTINHQRKSVNNNEKNENNNSNIQSEKTTDSFKKNNINMSFIENQS